MKIISGGQTGVDRGALDAALSLGIAAGGWCPANRTAEDGAIPIRYPVQPLPSGGNVERTAENVRAADATVIIHLGAPADGTKATADFCGEFAKPLLLLDGKNLSPADAARRLREFVRKHKISVLNVAGPRASEWPDAAEFAQATISVFLEQEVVGPAPRLSFIVPAHNEEHELPESLRAIRRAAEASGESFELIVVDDASTDATAAIAQQSQARLIAVNRRQIAAVRNAGAQVARGEILFFVDADTHITPLHVTDAVRALEAGCAGGSARVAVGGEAPLWARIFIRVFCAFYFAAGLGVGAFIFTRRDFFQQIGGFDERYFAAEEVYLTLALKKLGRFKILREPIVTSARKVRMHSPRFVLGQSLSILLRGKRALQQRDQLALWYDGKRERPQRAVQHAPDSDPVVGATGRNR